VPRYLYSAIELTDRAAYLLAEKTGCSLTTASGAGACSTSGSMRSVGTEALPESTDGRYAGSLMPSGSLSGNLVVAQLGR
jgi:hypothetical protein